MLATAALPPQAAAAAAIDLASTAHDAAAAHLSAAAAPDAAGAAAAQLADSAGGWHPLPLQHSHAAAPRALWDLADAAAAAGDATAAAADAAAKQDWLTPVADGLETVLRTLQGKKP